MPIPVLHMTGARLNCPTTAPVIRALGELGVPKRLMHMGQHDGERMSDVFFRQLGHPGPDVDLGLGSGSQARQTAAIMTGTEDLLVAAPTGLVARDGLPAAVLEALAVDRARPWPVPPLWDGRAGARIADVVRRFLPSD